MIEESEQWLSTYFDIRLRLTSSARCAVLGLSFTPSASIFDGALFAMLRSGNSDDGCGWPGCMLFFPLPMFIGILAAACDGDGLRTIAPPGTSACLSLKNIGSFTCNSADCCTTTFGKLWDRFKCWDYSTYKPKSTQQMYRKKRSNNVNLLHANTQNAAKIIWVHLPFVAVQRC